MNVLLLMMAYPMQCVRLFVSLYEKDLIYRGEYIINWDPQAKTALSDIEVIHKDLEGAFYHVSYPLSDGSGVLEIATTRPETILGDQRLLSIQKMNATKTWLVRQ